jgi:hypothetical protein
MKKKKKKKKLRTRPIIEIAEGTSEDRIFKMLSTMRHRDMQRACILRGMEFEKVIKFDHDQLIGWLYKNWDNSENPHLLIEYDIWLDNQLASRGHDAKSPLRNSAFNFSIKEPEFDLPKPKNNHIPKGLDFDMGTQNKKPKREKNPDWGIQTGTKKFLTYELTIEDKLPLEEVIPKVKEKFPAAEVKSIKIWYGRAKKLIK